MPNHHSSQPDIAAIECRELLTVPEAAERLKLKPGTIYNWISQKHLTREQGVIHLGRKAVRIVWPVFFERVVGGDIE